MKIAVIGAKSIPAKSGGIERYCQELYPQIVKRGHEVDLYVRPNRYYPAWFSNFTYLKMKVITLPSLSSKKLSLVDAALATIYASCKNYDVIHFHGISAAWFAWFAQVFSRSAIIVTCHQLELPESFSHRLFRRLLPWVEKMTISYVDEIIVTSQALVSYFWRKYRLYPQYIANAPTRYEAEGDGGIYQQAFGLDHSRYILYVGTFKPNQRLDLLIKAFQELDSPDWKLVLAGDISHSFSYTIELLQLAKQEKNIIFTGEITDNFLAELVRGADLFVEPSAGSDLNSSHAVLEAMREGVPIVASDTVTHRRLIGRDRGLLFKSGQFDSLLEQLQYAMSQPNLLVAMVKKAQTYIAINHNWDKVIYKNLFVYLQLTTKIPNPSAYKASPRQ